MPTLADMMRSESLTRLLDLEQLRELRDGFVAATGLTPVFRDADGEPIEGMNGHEAPLHGEAGHAPDDATAYLEAPIVIDGVRMGSVTLEGANRLGRSPIIPPAARDRLRDTALSLGVPEAVVGRLLEAVDEACDCRRTAAAQLLSTFAHGVAHLCAQQLRGQQSSRELDALYELSTLLARHRDVQQVLDAAARCAAQVMRVKAASIRLLGEDGRHLIVRAVHNLSIRYVRKGPVAVEHSEIYRRALAGEVVYVENMATDPRVIYPEFSRQEGLASILCTGLRFRDRAIGVIRIYTERPRAFSESEMNLLKAISHLLATAIENARLDLEFIEGQRVQRQLQVAAAVQRRMIPAQLPTLAGFEFAARYEPSLDLSGDFYDVIHLDGHLGLAVGDVVGKGIAASLLMASVRSALRAYAQDVYDLDEILRRVNVQLTRDTLDSEFTTLFYGVLNPRAMKFTYCNAGHEPALLMRDGQCRRLNQGGMALGIDANQRYQKDVVDLRTGDVLLLYTDGLSEAQNFDGKPFGRERIVQAMRDTAGATAQETLNHVFWEMRRFVGLNRGVDDTTMLAVKVVGK